MVSSVVNPAVGVTDIKETLQIIKSLKSDKAARRLGNPDAYLPRRSFANFDVDMIISTAYQIPTMVFRECSNGGGFVLSAKFGFQYFKRCKICFVYIYINNIVYSI